MAMDIERARARCWLEIDLDAVEANFDAARAICGERTQIIPVLKGNAYGFGAEKLARVLAAKGARLFAVAELNEALAVMRASGVPALVLGRVAPCQMQKAVEAGAVMTVFTLDMARAIDAAAAKVGKTARVHVKLDTGMHRLGFDWQSAARALPEIFALKNLRVEGLYTHLALRERAADERQIERFLGVVDALRRLGFDPGMLHACDSIGMVRYPEFHFDAVRTGAWLYGAPPTRYPNANGECRVAMRLMARVAQVRRVAAGEYIGYDEDHPLARDCVVATLTAGFADGFPRLNSVGAVLVRGRRAPVAGLVCMDQMTVDVTGIPDVAEGDAVTLLGGELSLFETADWAHTNRNDLLSRVGMRVPRVYLRGGEVEEIKHYNAMGE